MKRGATDHPKMYELAKLMNIPHALAVGYMELLWHFTAKYAPQGDIGKHTDDRIAKACHYQGRASRLVSAMCDAGWLDVCPRYRLRVHDWGDHADQGVQRALKAKGLDFVSVTQEKTSSGANQELAHLSLALPKPLPVPMPVSESKQAAARPHQLDFEPLNGIDPGLVIRDLIADMCTFWPMHGNVPRAEMVAQREWASSGKDVGDWVATVARSANAWWSFHRAQLNIKPRHFVPTIERWFSDGDYTRTAPKVVESSPAPGNYDHLPLGFTAEEKAKMERVARERAEDGLI